MKADAKKKSKEKDSNLPMRQRIQSEIIAWFWVALAFLLINGSIGQARVIPSGSMENTLLIGDHLIMSRIGYDAGVPFTGWHVPLWRNPKRQQIVIFKPPYNPTLPDYVKRVIGLPGETIDVHDGSLYAREHGTSRPVRLYQQVTLQSSRELLFRDGRQPRQFTGQPVLGLHA